MNIMAASCINTSDLSILPAISFAFVEKFISDNTGSSGKEQMTKGFKYYSEGYVHSVKLFEDINSCRVTCRCYKSMRKNEMPHSVEVILSSDDVSSSKCSCTIGQSGSCGHVTALLYQLAYYKQMNLKVVPTDIAKTSLPQTWHQPRGDKIRGSKLDDIVVQGYDRDNPHRPTKEIRSTLYNPIPEDGNFDCDNLVEKTKKLDILFPTVVSNTLKVQTKFEIYPLGSVLSYQQTMESDFLLNLMDASDFPELPVRNVMKNNLSDVCVRRSLFILLL